MTATAMVFSVQPRFLNIRSRYIEKLPLKSPAMSKGVGLSKQRVSYGVQSLTVCKVDKVLLNLEEEKSA